MPIEPLMQPPLLIYSDNRVSKKGQAQKDAESDNQDEMISIFKVACLQ
jgi:hypothetical protein